MIPTYNKDGHLFFRKPLKEDSFLGDALIINGDNIKEEIGYINANRIKSIIINSAYYKIERLDFLKDVPEIEGISILQNDLDLTPLYFLGSLKELRLDIVKSKIDFSAFSELKVLGVTYSKYTTTISECKSLTWLWLDNYRADNLEQLSSLSQLQYLNLHKTSIENLKGIGKMKKLVYLRIDTATKLASLAGLSESNSNLETLDIYGAKNLTDYSDIGTVKSLKKVFLGKTGEAANISFLKELPRLQQVSVGMKVTDGDMLHLQTIPEAGFVNFPHYNFRMQKK